MRRSTLIIWLWAGLLALLVCAPLLRPGYVLSYDMVWVPHLDLDRLETWGLGSALPRAVPSDGVIAVLGAVIPQAVLQRLLLGAVFVLGAVGAARLVPHLPTPARLVAATFFVWNPFVAERLGLGQWPLLLGYAALPWVLAAVAGDGRTREAGPRWGQLTLGLGAMSLTPVGGLMGLLAVLATGWRHGPGRLIALVGALNAPWIVAGLMHRDAARSDPAGAVLFALQADGPLGRLWSAMSLGGIWNGDVVPTTREVWTTVLLVLAGWVVMGIGLLRWPADEHPQRRRLAVLGVVGLVVALLGWVAPGFVQWWVESVPGGGLLRDGTRFLALLAPISAVALAHGAAVIAAQVPGQFTRRLVPVLLVALPIASLPDLSWGLSGRLQPAEYPQSWVQMREEIQVADVTGDLLILPFTPYRAPQWNDDRPVLDPAGRYFDRTTVVNDDLTVSGVTLRGEDPRVDEVFEVLAGSSPDPQALRDRGIGLVLVDASAPEASAAVGTVARLQLVATHGDLALFSAGDAEPDQPKGAERAVVTAAWVLAALVLLVVPALAAYSGRRRKTGRGR